MSLLLRPISLRDASRYVARWHRHLGPPRGGLFALSAWRPGALEPCAVVIVGRPVARMEQDGVTCEITRLAAVEGERNASSFLYGKAKRAAVALGYLRGLTSNRQDESGASLRAVGAELTRMSEGKEWDRPARRRTIKGGFQLAPKNRWTLWDLREEVA